MYSLYYQDILVGTVEHKTGIYPYYSGTFICTKEKLPLFLSEYIHYSKKESKTAEGEQKTWNAFMEEHRHKICELIELEDWLLVDDKGCKSNIPVPFFLEGGTICWQQ